ncbi:hypothetical protein GL2_36740 [Microbulbifer sp. GL-2]|nr:hypothetical protein GL2_00120 [Microbulbifer sp. GL-2]BBM00082.1 hypothetical protein GL2_01560 [Microbulbifer sp. GL-2]BBM03600.1 hypothetical protein GL2_36740 [Microbulbifer sp. GL-2]
MQSAEDLILSELGYLFVATRYQSLSVPYTLAGVLAPQGCVLVLADILVSLYYVAALG